MNQEIPLKEQLLSMIHSVGIERVVKTLAYIYKERSSAADSHNAKMLFAKVHKKLLDVSDGIL